MLRKKEKPKTALEIKKKKKKKENKKGKKNCTSKELLGLGFPVVVVPNVVVVNHKL